MTERKTNSFPSREDNMKAASRQFEEAWRICNGPNKYSFEQVSEAVDFLVQQTKNYLILANSNDSEISMKDLDLVYIGLYHYKNLPK